MSARYGPGEAAPQADGGMSPGEMTEDELIDRARSAMMRAASQPVGSLGRSVQWGVHDTYMDELRRRAAALLAGTSSGEW